MTFSLTWLAPVLRAAGLKVTEEPGWETRGHGDASHTLGVLCHHTAGPLGHGCDPSLGVVEHGRPDLPGPLAQLLLDREGGYHCVAAGLAYHAGKGEWQGIALGNSHFIGIEAENTGLPNDPWPEVQMTAYATGCAAILKHIGAKPIMCAGHKEYARPRGRKSDPDFDMDAFRFRVATAMNVLRTPLS